jgi:hypothetical protein
MDESLLSRRSFECKSCSLFHQLTLSPSSTTCSTASVPLSFPKKPLSALKQQPNLQKPLQLGGNEQILFSQHPHRRGVLRFKPLQLDGRQWKSCDAQLETFCVDLKNSLQASLSWRSGKHPRAGTALKVIIIVYLVVRCEAKFSAFQACAPTWNHFASRPSSDESLLVFRPHRVGIASLNGIFITCLAFSLLRLLRRFGESRNRCRRQRGIRVD